MADTVTLVNQITAPVVYTDDARVIGAGERIEGVTLDDTGQHAVDRGDLAVVDRSVATEKKTATKAKKTGDDTPAPSSEDPGAPGQK